ncbi:MAG: hypothetical protein CL534_05900 [Ahrensia sp.]|nr:hypothetical protein [Ahrensia sp.]
MRLLIALALMLAFLTNGAVAQYRGEANTGMALALAQAGGVSDHVSAEPTSAKVCMRTLLTGLPDSSSTLPGPPCSSDFKLFREVEPIRFAETRPYLGASRARKLRPVSPALLFRPPIS